MSISVNKNINNCYMKKTIGKVPDEILMKYNKLTPNLSVKNVAESVLFYQEMLGFKLEMAVPDGTTRIENEILKKEEYAYAMVSKDEVHLMFLNEKNFKCDIPILHEFPQGASVLFYIDVENIKEIYAHRLKL